MISLSELPNIRSKNTDEKPKQSWLDCSELYYECTKQIKGIHDGMKTTGTPKGSNPAGRNFPGAFNGIVATWKFYTTSTIAL